MKGRIKAALFLMTVIAAALIAAVTYRQVYSTHLVDHPGNRRPVLAQYKVERGEIFAADGTVLTTNEPSAEGYRRTYPGGEPFAPITGYFDPLLGRSGLEAAWEEWLGGRDHFASAADWFSAATNRGRRGSDLTLTLDPELQRFASSLLAGSHGAIVAIDPNNGAVKAMAVNPTFDPNRLSEDWDSITAGDGALVNRAIQSRYPPGSTFKIVTAAAALESGVASPSSKYNGPAVLPVYGSKVTNFAGQEAGRLSLAQAFAKSTNTVFAQLGLKLGARRLINTARAFGFGSNPPFDLPTKTSAMAPWSSMDKVMVAWSAVGQGETLATPLEMSLITAAVARDGLIFQPYLVEFVRDYNGKVQYRHKPRVWRRAVSAKTSASLKKMMIETVATGTGRAAALRDTVVAGKTGTAEVGGGQAPHAWFVGFAPAENPQVAVAVLVENGGTGGGRAAPLAREVIKRALGR